MFIDTDSPDETTAPEEWNGAGRAWFATFCSSGAETSMEPAVYKHSVPTG
jgi:hypothetical protein